MASRVAGRPLCLELGKRPEEQQLQRPCRGTSMHVGTRTPVTSLPYPPRAYHSIRLFTRTIFSWSTRHSSQECHQMPGRTCQGRNYLSAFTVPESLICGHLLSCFWPHCEAECHGRWACVVAKKRCIDEKARAHCGPQGYTAVIFFPC